MRAPVAQLDRASASGVEGRGFESRRVYHFFCGLPCASRPAVCDARALRRFTPRRIPPGVPF